MTWSDDDLDLALRDLRDEEFPTGVVRARVMSEVSRRRGLRWWQWAWVPALAAALFVMVPKETPVEPPPLLARAPGVPVIEQPVTAVAVTAAKPRVPKVEPPPVQSSEFVKVITDDPDVVILWAMNTEGDR